MVRDVSIAAGWIDISRIRKVDQNLDSLFAKEFPTLNWLNSPTLDILKKSQSAGSSFAVHTHARPGAALYSTSENDWWKMIYTYRDPRAIALSAYDHGIKNRALGIIRPFGWILNIPLAILYARNLSRKWVTWYNLGSRYPDQVMLIKYESLLDDPVKHLDAIRQFIGLDLPLETVRAVVEKYSREQIESSSELQSELHYNRGEAKRFQNTFSRSQIVLANLVLRRYLNLMGYQDE